MDSERDDADDRGVTVLVVGADRVSVVEPERVRIFDGDRFDTACATASRSPRDGQLEERVSEVIEPVATERLLPLSASARKDPQRVASAYENVYGALV